MYNSCLDLHESAAFMGVDISVPNLLDYSNLNKEDINEFNRFIFKNNTFFHQGIDNRSFIRFYNNGRCLDNGTGRQLNLGTNFLCACNGLIDPDSHLDIAQEFPQDERTTKHELILKIVQNDGTIKEELQDRNITGQSSIHTIYLAGGSNITVGTDGNVGIDKEGMVFELTTKPTFVIADNFFSFETQGGDERLPELSGTTGKGAIFVDANGKITIENKRANFSLMVVKSYNGIIDLPKQNVFFDTRVGITDWRLDLANEDQQVIVEAGESLSNYTLDWIGVCKDICDTSTSFSFESGFFPYEPDGMPVCSCEDVDIRNLTSLPVVKGEVDQLQIKRSRLGDQVHILIDGTDSDNAFVRELVFLSGFDSAEAPVGVVVLQGAGRVGLGSSQRDLDSTQTSGILGINGITLVPNGDGIVELNSDLVINNACHIIPGPHFGKDLDIGITKQQSLIFHSSEPRELRVKSTGILDLSKFNKYQVLEFAGQTRLVLEPGAQIRFNKDVDGGTLLMQDSSTIILEQDFNKKIKNTDDTMSTEDMRVRLTGNGTIVLQDYSQLYIPQDALLSVESDG